MEVHVLHNWLLNSIPMQQPTMKNSVLHYNLPIHAWYCVTTEVDSTPNGNDVVWSNSCPFFWCQLTLPKPHNLWTTTSTTLSHTTCAGVLEATGNIFLGESELGGRGEWIQCRRLHASRHSLYSLITPVMFSLPSAGCPPDQVSIKGGCWLWRLTSAASVLDLTLYGL